MKIAIFTENSYCGGLDSFLVYLIDQWPHPEDELVIICNASHPGLKVIAGRTKRHCRIVAHTIPLQWEWMDRFARLPLLGRLRKVLSPLVRYPFFVAYLVGANQILRREAPDRLMVVNGGYPGGDTNRAATIAWGSLRGTRPPSVHNVHNLAIVPRWWERAIENVIDSCVARHTLAFVAVSEACGRSLANRPMFQKGCRVDVIYNGIPNIACSSLTDRSAMRDRLNVPKDAPMCLMLGTFELRKGHAFLLRAFQLVVGAVPAAHLVICGYGTVADVKRVRALVDEFGLARHVRIEGFREDVQDLLAASDLVVVPSQTFESFGLMIVEAMAQRVPVVATNVGGIPEVLGADEGGRRVASHDVAGFAERIVEFLGDKALRQRTGGHGYERYRKRFTAERMAGEYALLLRAGSMTSQI
jgi:L-malate glycosyltransferase